MTDVTVADYLALRGTTLARFGLSLDPPLLWTVFWRYRNGKTAPGAKTLLRLSAATDEKVSVDEWLKFFAAESAKNAALKKTKPRRRKAA